MATLTIGNKEARKIYPNASPEIKTILEESFGKPFFSQKITDVVKSFEDACDQTGEDSRDAKFSTGTTDEIAFKKLKVVIRALNQDWKANWNDSSQRKWTPWFYLDKPGFRFDDACYDLTDTSSASGSRLCFATSELAEYAANQFLSLYKDLMD